MSDDSSDPPGATGDLARPLMIGAGVVLILILILAFFSLLLVIDLRGEVADSAEQARKAVKATKAIQDELAEMRKAAPSAKASEPPRSAPAQPTHIDAADTRSDCVIRPGSGKGLAECIGSAPR